MNRQLPDGPLTTRLRISFLVYALIGFYAVALAVWIAVEIAS